MADFTFRVEPEIMKQKAEALHQDISDAQKAVREMSRLVSASRSYWEGDSAEALRKQNDKAVKSVETVLKRMANDPGRLLSMAGIYSRAESTNRQTAQALRGNVIE